MKKIGSLRCENLTDFFKGDKRFSESMGFFFLNKIIEQTQPQAVPWLSHPLNACNWSLEAATITGGKKRSSHDVSQKFGASQKIQSKCWISVTNPHMNCSDTQKKLTGPNKKNGGMHSSIINFDDHLWSPQKKPKAPTRRDFRHAICVVESCLNLRFFSKGALPRTPSECLLEIFWQLTSFLGIYTLVN